MSTGEQLLKEFCADYLAWVRGGAQAVHHAFRPDAGLCWAICAWTGGLEDFRKLNKTLHEALIAGNLDPVFPFNASDKAYYAEASAGECHLNPARLEFVERHAK